MPLPCSNRCRDPRTSPPALIGWSVPATHVEQTVLDVDHQSTCAAPFLEENLAASHLICFEPERNGALAVNPQIDVARPYIPAMFCTSYYDF